MNGHCHVDPYHKEVAQDELKNLHVQSLLIWGMGCINCATRVRNSLLSLKGVVEARVDHVSGQANVLFNPDLTSVASLTEAVAVAGRDGRHSYRAEPVILQVRQ